MTGRVIETVRPNWSLLLTAVVAGVAAGYRGGLGVGILAFLLTCICAGVWRIIALLGYMAGVMDAGLDDDDQDDGPAPGGWHG
jgi:hypothetical protein